MNDRIELKGNINVRSPSISGGTSMERVEVLGDVYIPHAKVYDGEYEVTPTTSTQVLDTGGMIMKENIVVKPIPHNYGLVTWNGSVLTIT